MSIPHILTATEEIDCASCGLNIHIGDEVVLNDDGWVHPICDPETAEIAYLDREAERQHDERRERE